MKSLNNQTRKVDIGIKEKEMPAENADLVKRGIYAADSQGNIFYADQPLAEILHYSNRRELIGLNLAENLYEQRSERDGFLKILSEKGHVSDYAIRMVRKNGTKVVISARSNVVKDQAGKVIGVEGVLKEASEEYEHNETKEKTALEILEIEEKNEQIAKDLETISQDSLTGVYNYQYFLKCLDAEVKRADRFFRPLSLMMLNIDQCTAQGGLGAGPDDLIKKVGDFLKKNLRETDILCRQSQDQFLIILPETKRDEAVAISKTLKEGFEQAPFPKDVAFSIGMSRFIPGMTTQEFLLKTNLGSYMAKEVGKNEACFYG